MPDEGISKHEYERLISESMRRKQKVRELTERLAETERALAEIADDRDKHLAEMKALADDRDGYKAKLETQPDELRTQVETLTGKIRARSHRDKFNDLAKTHIRPDGVDAAWELLGWKAESDDVDEAKMGTAITDLVGRTPLLKIPAESGGNGNGVAKTTQPTLAAGPGTSRGGQSQQRDPNAELAVRYPNPGRLA